MARTGEQILQHAWAVVSQRLATAEQWRYDAVKADFEEMIQVAREE